MRSRPFSLSALGGLLGALGLIGAACGGGGEPETGTATQSPGGEETSTAATGEGALGAYFEEIDSLHDDFVERGDALSEQFPDAFTEPEATRDYYVGLVPIFDDFLDGLSDVDPPSEVEDSHSELLDSLAGVIESLEDLVDRLAAAESSSELEDLLNAFADEPDFVAARDRFQTACFDLQSIADDGDVVIDLECETESEQVVLSLAEYFQQIDTIFEDSDEQLDQTETDFNNAFEAATTMDERIRALRVFLDETDRVLFLSLVQLGQIQPPPEVQQFHDDFVSEVEAVAQLAKDFFSALASVSVQTDADVDELTNQFDFDVSAATARADQACFSLQGIADENSIDVDLNCED